jgi:hypothetical protein
MQEINNNLKPWEQTLIEILREHGLRPAPGANLQHIYDAIVEDLTNSEAN